MISLTDDRKMLGYGLLGAYPNISHFVTTRHGGYSEGRMLLLIVHLFREMNLKG